MLSPDPRPSWTSPFVEALRSLHSRDDIPGIARAYGVDEHELRLAWKRQCAVCFHLNPSPANRREWELAKKDLEAKP